MKGKRKERNGTGKKKDMESQGKGKGKGTEGKERGNRIFFACAFQKLQKCCKSLINGSSNDF